MEKLYEDIMALSLIPGTSGNEDAVCEYITEKLRYNDSVTLFKDNLGNLIASKTGNKTGKTVMFCAHMDETGFIITHIDEKGFLKFSSIGDMDPRTVIGKRAIVGDKMIPGLIGSKAIHLVSKEDLKKETDLDDLYIDIGADSLEEAKKSVDLGDRAVYDSSSEMFGKDGRMLSGRALDNRCGCALLIDLLNKESEYDFYAVFSSRSETGSASSAAANRILPEISVTVDACPAMDIPNTDDKDMVCRLSKGAVLAYADRRIYYDMDLYHKISKICDNKNIKWQTKEGVFGTNDSASLQKSAGGVRIAFAGYPVRYNHTCESMVSLDDIDNLSFLLSALVPELCSND